MLAPHDVPVRAPFLAQGKVADFAGCAGSDPGHSGPFRLGQLAVLAALRQRGAQFAAGADA